MTSKMLDNNLYLNLIIKYINKKLGNECQYLVDATDLAVILMTLSYHRNQ